MSSTSVRTVITCTFALSWSISAGAEEPALPTEATGGEPAQRDPAPASTPDEKRRGAEGEAVDATQTRAPSRAAVDARIQAALESLAGEPALEELGRAAVARADADLEVTRSWSRRPNAAAVLPTLKLVFDYDTGRDESLDRYQEKPDRWGADSDQDLGFQVQAQWELDELIFNSDEIRVWNAIADRVGRREALLGLLTSYYFERRRLQLVALLAPPSDLTELIDLQMRIGELTSAIDSLTGGLLSRRLE